MMSLVEEALREGIPCGQFPPPWPGSDFAEVMLLEQKKLPLVFATLVGMSADRQRNELVSAFPVLTETEEWIVQVNASLANYGPHEGMIEGDFSHGAPLRWFAPRFGLEREQWRHNGLACVALAALALRLEPFKAEPIIVKEGDMVKMERKRLREEGRVEESENPDLSVTVLIDQLRMFAATGYDNHEFVGKIERVRAIQPRPELAGWIVDVEIHHDQPATGWRMPVYVFPAAAGDYRPKRGDLVQGIAWLQGQFVRPADESDRAAWLAAGGGKSQAGSDADDGAP